FFASGEVDAGNTIIAGNIDLTPTISGVALGPKSPDCLGALHSLGYNLIGNSSGCFITGDTVGNIVNVDPRLGPLQNNGGQYLIGSLQNSFFTSTHALLQGSFSCSVVNFRQICIYIPPSRAIDAGNNCLPDDQRLFLRPADGNGDGIARCDIGAFEFTVPA